MKSLTLFISLSLALLLTPLHVQGAETGWTTPRTEHGHPDLQGLWGNRTQTPMERPEALGEQRTYTEEEAHELEESLIDTQASRPTVIDPDREAPPVGERIGNEAEVDYSDVGMGVTRINGEYRTSLVVDPPNGRFPFVEGGRQKDIYGQWRAQGFNEFDGPEIRPAGERCLSAIGTMPPMVLLPYNSNAQIVQNKDYVMIMGEMVHDARIIRLNSEHQPDHMKYWFGDSIGHWESDTLVVHTKNFRPEISNFRVVSSELLEVSERFTIVSDDRIFYTYTVTDPNIYTQPYTVEMNLYRLPPDELMYEFACHEGNYSMEIILRGARQQEHDARLLEQAQ
ncbi:MAG: hypothetical protein Q8L60_07285 [Gammaproteobacteria bacterium]|nr:hypothetical protein [Gammaproteobacteria bacterium]MDP2141737.1 hypothetical protein [Gammaproteobacteria bacterium]MDP2347970.1 hypothetical protein [Gammaproteobacteria bacterium]